MSVADILRSAISSDSDTDDVPRVIKARKRKALSSSITVKTEPVESSAPSASSRSGGKLSSPMRRGSSSSSGSATATLQTAQAPAQSSKSSRSQASPGRSQVPDRRRAVHSRLTPSYQEEKTQNASVGSTTASLSLNSGRVEDEESDDSMSDELADLL